MGSPEELDAVDWASLTHAYGSAEDVPHLVRALYSDDPEEVDAALYELFGNVLHQGSVYPATVEAVRFLAHAAANARYERDSLLMLLAEMAGDEPPAGSVERQVRQQVAAAVPGLLPSLRDPDRAVRRAAVRLAAVATDVVVPLVVEELQRLYQHDPVTHVRADALTALAQLDLDPTPAAAAAAAVAAREAEALAGEVPVLRHEAALLAMERSGPPYPPQLVRILGEVGADPDPGENDFPFPGLGTGEQRVAKVLDADPEAALAVLRIWIANGDVGAHGSFRADQIACQWRDREEPVVTLLTAALPHQTDPNRLALCLEAIARWLPRVREPAPELLDLAADHLADEHDRTAAAAQLVLARQGDSRFLTAVPTPAPHALIALAARTSALEHQQRALRNPVPRHIGELLAVLTPQRAEPLLPELKELLRTRCAPIPVARRLGELGVSDQELVDLLTDTADGTDDLLGACATVAAARLGGDPASPLRLLERLLAGGKQVHWYLDECGRLGGLGSPLLPQIEELCYSSHDWTRMAAARAHWRITADPERAAPILAEIAGPSPVGLQALRALADIGAPPEELRPRLRHWAFSPRRLLATHWPPDNPHPDDELRDTCLRLLSN